MLMMAFQKAYQLDGVKTQIKNFCLSAITLHGEQMTLPEMDFITLVAWEPRASQLESTPVMQQNITAHFLII